MGTKAELAKYRGPATYTLKTILSQEDAFAIKSDTLGNAAKMIKTLKASLYAELKKILI